MPQVNNPAVVPRSFVRVMKGWKWISIYLKVMQNVQLFYCTKSFQGC